MPAQPSPESTGREISCDYGLPGDKLEPVIIRFISESAADPFSTWLLLPTQRLVTYVTEYLINHNIPVITSRICTPDGFCTTVFEENRTTDRFLPKGQAKMLLAGILADPDMEIPFFTGRSRPSSGTVDDLMTFMNVITRRKVLFPECLMELESEKSRQLDDIITEYYNRLREADLVDSDIILRWTIDHLNGAAPAYLSCVLMYGFHEPLPLEQDLFDAIREHAGKTTFFIPDGLDPDIFRSRRSTGSPEQSLSFDPSSARAQITGLFVATGPLPDTDQFRLQTFPSRHMELFAIASEIARLNETGTPLSDIAVAFPDLRQQLALVDEVFSDFGIPWNAAVGSRLSQAPVIQFYRSIAGLSSGMYTRENIVRLIGSPYFRRGPVPGGSAYLSPDEVDLVSRYAGIDGPHPDWDRRLGWLSSELQKPEKSKNFRGISVHSVERVREGTGILIGSLKALSGSRPLRDHVAAFRNFLENWEIPALYTAPDEKLKDLDIRANAKFQSRLDALVGLPWMQADVPVSAEEFFRLVLSIADEPDDSRRVDEPGVNVIGVRECEHMKFPVLFIAGLVEGDIPRLTTRLPFTNSLENIRMGTRSLSEILREGEYYFIAALLAGQKTVYLSAPLADGDRILLTSAFFERVRARTGDQPWPDSGGSNHASLRTSAIHAGEKIRGGEICPAAGLIPDTLNISDLAGRVAMERYHRTGPCDSPYDGILPGDASIEPVLAGQYGPDHVYSPTSLELYATCPFAYFINRILNIEALPEVEPNLSASDRGTVIHDILSSFYREWRTGGRAKVTPSLLADATEMILRIAGKELERYSFQSPLWDATRILMLGSGHTGPGYFERFLESETGEADSPLVPSRFEYSFGMEPDASDDPGSRPEPVELVAPDGARRLRIRGRIDRIDIAPDGRFLIWDYKSGSQHPKAKDIEAGTALQIPLYLLAFGQVTGAHGIGGGYYKIRREVERNIVLADTAAKDLMISRIRPSADFTGLVRHSCDCAFTYIAGIREGRFPLPAEEKCPNEYCDFRRICRFNPYRVLDTGEET